MNTIPNISHKQQIRVFYRQLFTYFVIMSFLCFINYVCFHGYWWVIWPAAGWGIHLIIQAIYVFIPLNKENEEQS